MVHALSEIRRVLVPNGILIDLRPILDRWHIEVVSAREIRETGRIQDLPLGLADDEAANRSIAQAEQNGWFTRATEEFFPFYYSWDSPREMEEWVEEEWHDFSQLDEVSQQATRSTWALGDADANVRVKVKMLITRWKKEISGDDE
jgi:SAM-dependent methyltransferase